MKSPLALLLILIVSVAACAQTKKMTAAELAGFKGKVRSIITERSLLMLDNEKFDSGIRSVELEEFFDQTGNLKQDPNTTESKFTVKYSYDDKGRITEEAKFNEEGVQFFKTVFKYDAEGKVTEKTYHAGTIVTANNYLKYDSSGNLTELRFVPTEANLTGNPVIYSYSDYEFDPQGNWVKRLVSSKSNSEGKVSENQMMYYRKIEYFGK